MESFGGYSILTGKGGVLLPLLMAIQSSKAP